MISHGCHGNSNTGNWIVHSTACWKWQQGKYQSSALLTLCEGGPLVSSEFLSQRVSYAESFPWHDVNITSVTNFLSMWPVDSPHKRSVVQKVFHGMISSSQVSQIFYQCLDVTFCPNQSFLFPEYGKSQILPRAMCRFIMSMVSENISLQKHNSGLVPDCSISIADAMEIPQSCAKPLPCKHVFRLYKDVFYNVLFVHVTWCMAWLFNQPVKTCHRCPSPTGKIIIQCIWYT